MLNRSTQSTATSYDVITQTLIATLNQRDNDNFVTKIDYTDDRAASRIFLTGVGIAAPIASSILNQIKLGALTCSGFLIKRQGCGVIASFKWVNA
jgi:hypothetical protein